MPAFAKPLTLALILLSFTSLSLAAQSRTRLGDEWPTTDLTPSQRTFAESYLAAVKGTDIGAYKKLLHPTTRACMNAETADYFNSIFEARVNRMAPNARLSVEKLPAKFPMFDALAAQGFIYQARPTHAFHIDLVSTRNNDVSIIAFSALDNGVWYEVLPCPTPKVVAQIREQKREAAAAAVKAWGTAAAVKDPLRSELFAMMKEGNSLGAAMRYSMTAHVDIKAAQAVVDALKQQQR